MGIGAATAAAAAIGAAGTIGSAVLTSNAADNAAKQAQNAADKNLAFENQVYNQGVTNLQPTVQQGQTAGNALAGLLNIGGNPTQANSAFQNYLNSTNYQFLLNQGENAVKYANAPAFNSGATAKALNNYAMGQAGNALQGYEGLLAGQQGLGVQAAGTEAGVGTNIAGQEAAANNSAASAAGAAGLVGANAWGNAFTGLSKLVNQGVTQSSFGNAGSGVNPSWAGNINADPFTGLQTQGIGYGLQG